MSWESQTAPHSLPVEVWTLTWPAGSGGGGDAAAQGVQGGVDVVGFFHSVPAFLVLAALGPRQVTQG